MHQKKPFLKKYFKWQNLIYEREELVDLEPILEENYKQVYDTEEYLATIETLLENQELPMLKRYCKWIDFFSERIFHKTSIYYELAPAIGYAVLENEVFRTQTEYEFQLSLYFFKMFYEQGYEISFSGSEEAKALLNISLMYGKYPGMQLQSLKKCFRLFEKRIVTDTIDSFFQQFFVKYENPYLLTDYLGSLKTLEEFGLLMWVLQGNNIRSFNARTSRLSKKEGFYFMNTRPTRRKYTDYILERALFLSKLMIDTTLTSNAITDLLQLSKMYQKNPIKMLQDAEFWKKVIAFYVQKVKTNRVFLFSLVEYLDFIEYKRYEEDANFSLAGRTAQSLKRLIDDWHQNGSKAEQELMKRLEWKHNLVAELPINKGKDIYLIKELTSGLELYEEGKVLLHCIFAYTSYCASGHMRIYSVRKIQQDLQVPQLSIEVQGKKIKQIAGKLNRPDSSEEREVISEWAKTNEFEFDL